jgi:hypothetical protein
VNAVGGELADAEQPLMWTQVFDAPGKLACASVAVVRSTRQALTASVAAARMIRPRRGGVAGMSMGASSS